MANLQRAPGFVVGVSTEFADGHVDGVRSPIGRQKFDLVAVADENGPVVMDVDTGGGIDPDPDDWAQRIGYQAHDGRTWIFELEPGGQMSQFSGGALGRLSRAGPPHPTPWRYPRRQGRLLFGAKPLWSGSAKREYRSVDALFAGELHHDRFVQQVVERGASGHCGHR